ncbi:1-aminocyclopropane-1-carboxylate oxidase-like protein [Corchorus olitorius]|uniref:1-aminocyclopropane-1-carboxylate oxidase-like protein n=1 Tax=Corchorus olitorius TaxID=93759 RepID=A0A1R3H6Y7_9ROSI|nr:1-aminocyclopropane-1-carboxylate oxidase-like protein [Corchorus olitorius]
MAQQRERDKAGFNGWLGANFGRTKTTVISKLTWPKPEEEPGGTDHIDKCFCRLMLLEGGVAWHQEAWALIN